MLIQKNIYTTVAKKYVKNLAISKNQIDSLTKVISTLKILDCKCCHFEKVNENGAKLQKFHEFMPYLQLKKSEFENF